MSLVHQVKKGQWNRVVKKESVWLFLCLVSFFVFFQLKTVYGGDGGDFLSAVAVGGIPHPPGYPLYTLLATFLNNFFSFSTPAFRLAFLSSLPAALAITFLYRILKIIFSRKVGLISSLFLAFAYPFWLYSETVEVFSLNNFFIILISFLLIKLVKSKKTFYLNLLFLFLGLSLSHHQTIIFLLPAIYFVFKQEKLFKKISLKAIALFFLGLLPYLYLPLAARKNPAVNWGNPVSFGNFWAVISRQAYGTFQANQGILRDFKGRLINLFAFFRFFIADFGLIGSIVVVLGIASFFSLRNKDRKKRLILTYCLISLLAYVFFIFYASFNIFADFTVATFERFLLAPYIFLTVFAAAGLSFLDSFLGRQNWKKKKFIGQLFWLVFFLVLPFFQLIKNYPKISILKDDLTAENFAQDILDSVEKGGVLFTRTDTTHFNSQYLFYSLGYRKEEVVYINVFFLPASYYQDYLRKTYPQLKINLQQKNLYSWKDFLKENYDQLPIYSIPQEDLAGYQSVSWGLVFRYFKKEDLPQAEKLISFNDSLWQGYHNPLAGSLGKYKNLFLADVVNYYQRASKKFASFLIEQKKYSKAEEYLNKSLSFQLEDPQLELFLGRVYLEQKKCSQAEAQFLKVKQMLPDDPFPDAYLRQLYLNCYQSEEKAKDFLDSCLDKEDKLFPQLKDL